MKRIYLLFFICNTFVINVYAQIEKNHLLAETSLNYFHKNTNTQYFYYSDIEGEYVTYPRDIRETTFLSATKLGYTLTKNFAIGISFQFTSSKTSNKQILLNREGKDSLAVITIIETSDLAPGFYARKFFKLNDKFYLSSTFNFSYHLKTYFENKKREFLLGIIPSYQGHAKTFARTSFSLDLSASFLYRIKNRIAIQVKVFRANYGFKLLKSSESPDDIFSSKTIKEKKPLDLDIDISPINWEYGVVFIF